MLTCAVLSCLAMVSLAGQSATSRPQWTCMRTTIVSIHPAVNGGWSGNGMMTFADGRYAVLFAASSADDTRASALMRDGDDVEICISLAPRRCPPGEGHHQIKVVDLSRRASFLSLANGAAMDFRCEE